MTIKYAATTDIAACQAVRHAVFVLEQGVDPALEQDGLDEQAHHILASENGVPIGAARILIKDGTGKIGRVCVLASHRGHGLGADLIRTCLDHLRGLGDVTRAELGAQTHALDFYSALGFSAFGPEYQEINTPHQMMEQPL